MSVGTLPGATQFTLMPCFPHSLARLFVIWEMPAFVAAYTACPATTVTALTEPMLIITPPAPRRSMSFFPTRTTRQVT